MHHLVQASHPPVNCQKFTTINDVLCGLGGGGLRGSGMFGGYFAFLSSVFF